MTEFNSVAPENVEFVVTKPELQFFHRLLQDELVISVGKHSAALYESYKDFTVVKYPVSAMSTIAGHPVASKAIDQISQLTVTKSLDGFACKQLNTMQNFVIPSIKTAAEPAFSASKTVAGKVSSCTSKFKDVTHNPVGKALSAVEALIGEDETEEATADDTAENAMTNIERASNLSKTFRRKAFAGLQNVSFRSVEKVKEMTHVVDLISYAEENFKNLSAKGNDLFVAYFPEESLAKVHNLKETARGTVSRAAVAVTGFASSARSFVEDSVSSAVGSVSEFELSPLLSSAYSAALPLLVMFGFATTSTNIDADKESELKKAELDLELLKKEMEALKEECDVQAEVTPPSKEQSSVADSDSDDFPHNDSSEE